MVNESRRRNARASTVVRERTCVFGTFVLARWPHKAALHLAQIVGCSERAANLYITGKRKITARCVRAIVDELFE